MTTTRTTTATRTRATLTTGELIAILSQYPADFPVTIGCPDNTSPNGAEGEYHFPEWMNVEIAEGPKQYDDGEYEQPSVILFASNDFDSRQW